MYTSVLFNMGAYRRDRKHTGVLYAEKRPRHCYIRRSATPTARIRRYMRYADLHAVSSLQGPGARGMSLLETSSYYGDQPRLQLVYGATVCRVQERGVCLC